MEKRIFEVFLIVLRGMVEHAYMYSLTPMRRGTRQRIIEMSPTLYRVRVESTQYTALGDAVAAFYQMKNIS